MIEVWKDFEYGYKFSNMGRVIGPRGFVLKPRVVGPKGGTQYYAVVTKQRVKPIRSVRVNRVVCELFNGPPPSDQHVAMHINGNSFDNRAENLRWGTQSENMYDVVKHGHHKRVAVRGEKAGISKLTEKQVIEIKTAQLVYTYGQNALLAEKYGVSRQIISAIKTGAAWNWLSLKGIEK